MNKLFYSLFGLSFGHQLIQLNIEGVSYAPVLDLQINAKIASGGLFWGGGLLHLVIDLVHGPFEAVIVILEAVVVLLLDVVEVFLLRKDHSLVDQPVVHLSEETFLLGVVVLARVPLAHRLQQLQCQQGEFGSISLYFARGGYLVLLDEVLFSLFVDILLSMVEATDLAQLPMDALGKVVLLAQVVHTGADEQLTVENQRIEGQLGSIVLFLD
jgi:hypothetical protein